MSIWRKSALWASLLIVTVVAAQVGYAQALIINHEDTDLTAIPLAEVNQAKDVLHIAYGHTSHGSQLTTGMTGLNPFINGGGLGLSYPTDTFKWNDGPQTGALDLDDYAMGGDCGYYPQWYNNTRNYLNNPSYSDVNVIIWSWCGQVASQSQASMISNYLQPMTDLEAEYPDVKFVYMTGHVNGTGLTGNLHLRNNQIRDYCQANGKILYDFEDIESYDPDGTYFGDKYVQDNCNYSGGNWATEWQNSHTQNVDWYDCYSAHSQPLNANRKAYAAWALWAELGKMLSRLEGDITDDGFVGGDDLNVILGNWGQTVTPGDWQAGDLTGNGLVNGVDLDVVLANWGQGEVPEGAPTLPEPTTMMLLALGATALLRRRRRR